MFDRELNQLKQRQLALRLRNIELRTELRVDVQRLRQPASWLGAAGAAVGAAGMEAFLNRQSQPGRWGSALNLLKLALRIARLAQQFRGR
jgi:hypothetical protein